MALSDADRDFFRSIAREVAREVAAEALAGTPCSCGLLPDEQRQMGHLVGFVKDIGHDSMARGVEELRLNSKFVMKWRAACEKTGSLILMTVVIGVCGLAATIAGRGFWDWIQSGGK